MHNHLVPSSYRSHSSQCNPSLDVIIIIVIVVVITIFRCNLRMVVDFLGVVFRVREMMMIMMMIIAADPSTLDVLCRTPGPYPNWRIVQRF